MNEITAERDAIAAEIKKEAVSIFDIFSTSPTDKELTTNNLINKQQQNRILKTSLTEGEDPLLQSNWDDGDGYYKPRIGELIADRYITRSILGKGVFSTVLLCHDNYSNTTTTATTNSILFPKEENITKNHVAIKMIRNNDTMRKAAEKEVNILMNIAETDPDNKKYCVRLLRHFEYRNHITMVFEPLQMNLRETIKKFGIYNKLIIRYTCIL